MSLHARVIALVGTVALMSSISGCRNDGPSGPVGGAFELGQSLSVGRGRDARVLGSTTGGIFYAVVVNSGLDSVGQAGFTLRATGTRCRPTKAASVQLLAAIRHSRVACGTWSEPR